MRPAGVPLLPARHVLAGLSDVGLVRARNEDAFAVEELSGDVCLLVVADGIGGYPGGDVAAQLAVAHLTRAAGHAMAAEPAEALREGFEAAERAVREHQLGQLSEMGTTLVAALVLGRSAWVANAGDSRAYLFDSAELRQLSHDHSWVADEIRAGRLDPNDPIARSRRNILTRSVGHGPEETLPDVFGPIEVPDGGVLLLCSDGLHSAASDDEIAAAVAGPPSGAAERLVSLALNNGGPDNVTVAVFFPAGA